MHRTLHHPAHLPHRTARHRGTVIVLVVAVLVLIAILGLMYMQVARMDRFSTRAMGTRHIDAIAETAAQRMQAILRADLLGRHDRFLDGAFRHHSFSNMQDPDHYLQIYEPASNEPFDYPGTNPQLFGHGDDAWLASNWPEYHNGGWVWPHLSNPILPRPNTSRQLHPIAFLRGVGTLPDPVEDPSLSHIQVPIDFNNPDLADATGDGIPDSRWTWAPIDQVRGIRYVMAVRIIDPSGMANVSTAFPLVDQAGQYSPAAAPTWMHPAELDLGMLFGTINSSGYEELMRLTDYRLGSASTSPTPTHQRVAHWAGVSLRSFNTVDPMRRFTLADELELRYRGGLNNPAIRSELERVMGNASHSILLRSGDSERVWQDAFPNLDNYFQSNVRSMITTYSGAAQYAGLPPIPGARLSGSSVPHNGTNFPQAQYEDSYRSARVFLTLEVDALSWEIRKVIDRGNFDVNADHYPFLFHGYDESWQTSTNQEGRERRQGFANQLAASFIDHVDSDNRITVVGEGTSNPSAQRVRRQMGMEALPFITEVFSHQPYEVVESQNTSEDPETPSTRWHVTASRLGTGGDPTGYAIEITNPFHRTISLENVYLVAYPVRDSSSDIPNAVWNGFNDRNADSQYALHLRDVKATLASGESIIVYRNAAGGPGVRELLGFDTSITRHVWNASAFDTNHANTDRAPRTMVVLQLHGVNQFDQIIKTPYQRLRHAPIDRVTHTANITGEIEYDNGGLPPDGDHLHKVRVTIGNRNGLNALAMRTPRTSPDHFANGMLVPESNTEPNRFRTFRTEDWYSGETDRSFPRPMQHDSVNQRDRQTIGRDNKTSVGGPPDVQQDLLGDGTVRRLADEIWPFPDYADNRPRSPVELMHVPLLAPRKLFEQRQLNWGWNSSLDVAEVFFLATQDGQFPAGRHGRFLDHFMFDYRSEHTLARDNTLGTNHLWDHQRYAHAAALINRFTSATIHPLHDGLDNNDDGTADSIDERFMLVPGRLNLNTTRYDILRHMLPIPDPLYRDVVAGRIINFRENEFRYDPFTGQPLSAPFAGNYRTASVAAGGAGLPPHYRQRKGIVHVAELLPVLDAIFGVDQQKNTELAGIPLADAGHAPLEHTADDRFERTLVLRWLLNTTTTRSDVFVAYIVVRGYEVGAFDRSPIEQRRFFLILDRSEIHSRFAPVRIVTRFTD